MIVRDGAVRKREIAAQHAGMRARQAEKDGPAPVTLPRVRFLEGGRETSEKSGGLSKSDVFSG